MKTIDLNTWERKKYFDHFNSMKDPFFGVTIPFNVSKAYQYAKQSGISFFGKYLHDCMKAINSIENFKFRIINEEVVFYDVIHASPTLIREDKTFGFSFIHFDTDLYKFLNNIKAEKVRIEQSTDLYPLQNSLDCIHCSALPWFSFTGHKEPVSGNLDSVPKLGFAKVEEMKGELIMNVSINVNHALIDGYHVGLFSEAFQRNLNSVNNI